MSLNVYESEQVIHFGAKPSRFFGWYVSGNCGASQEYPFDSAEQRADFLRVVGGGNEELAALACLAVNGGEEWQREGYSADLFERYPEKAEAALEAAQDFAASNM